MMRLPRFLHQRTKVRSTSEKQRIDRLADAYQAVFLLPNGDVTPHGQVVLADLAVTCMFAREDLPRNADEAMVRAALNAVYARILRLTSLRGDDVIVTTKELNND